MARQFIFNFVVLITCFFTYQDQVAANKNLTSSTDPTPTKLVLKKNGRIVQEFSIGQYVRLKLKNETTFTGQLTHIQPNEIIIDELSIPISAIYSIGKSKKSRKKNKKTARILAVILAIYLLLASIGLVQYALDASKNGYGSEATGYIFLFVLALGGAILILFQRSFPLEKYDVEVHQAESIIDQPNNLPSYTPRA